MVILHQSFSINNARAFSFACLRIDCWNSLPADILTLSLSLFKVKYKLYKFFQIFIYLNQKSFCLFNLLLFFALLIFIVLSQFYIIIFYSIYCHLNVIILSKNIHKWLAVRVLFVRLASPWHVN